MSGSDTTALVVHAHRKEVEDDDALLKAAMAEPAAFALLYERYYDRVYRYCRARTPTHEDGADLAQQVFLQAFSNLHRFRPRGSSFAAWLFRIAHNLAIDSSRRRRRQTIAWEDIADVSVLVSADLGPEDAAIRSDELARLRVGINALAGAQREVLILRFAVGLSIPEIAAVIGKSVSATQMRLWRALQMLRKDHE